MKCSEFQRLLPDYTTGNLTPAALRELEAHLSVCPACADEASRLRSAWERLGGLSEEAPGGALRTRFDAMLAQYVTQAECEAETGETDGAGADRGGTQGSGRVGAPSRPVGWWPRRPAAQFGLVLVLLAAGLGLGWHLRPGPGSRDIEALMSEVQRLRDEVALVRIDQASAVDRLSAINNIRQTGRLPASVLETLIGTLVSDPSVNVRLAAVDVLASHLDRQAVSDGLRGALPGQSSPLVQIAMIETLAGLDDPQGQQVVRDLLTDDRVDPAVRAHVRWRLGRSM
ncbi:MAG: HEAT repeat domain-containing protein [Candidatus Eisenbacteria sp.]|nr:HEAT repeat domain-containing protein [Candidatus Eisenbacteria bacterium]